MIIETFNNGTCSFILLVKVVDVAVQDLDEQFNGDGCIHASICNTQSPLKTFEDSLSITIKLG